jgi:hypothetical protein
MLASSTFWPPSRGASAEEQSRLLKAEVQRRIEAGEILEREALDLFECMAGEAKLGPRGLDDPGTIGREP